MARPPKLQPIGGDVQAFLDAIPNEQRQADARTMVALSAKITGEPPVLWVAGIVGFGEYRYRYTSGREGIACLAGFAPRKDSLVIYLTGDYQNHDRRLLDQLGPHRVGKSCLYVKRLSDIDLDVLAQLIVRSVDARREMDRAASA